MDFQELIKAFFQSWQFQTLAGLILIDIGLGAAKAVRVGAFEWQKLADFYKTNVVPYVIGFLTLFVAVNYVVPPEAFDGVGETINEGAVTLAWGTLLAKLLTSIKDNLALLYNGQQPPAQLPE